jgi:hypothetical protein
MITFQVTIPSGGGPVQFPSLQVQPQTMVLQNNAAAVMRVGDKTVSTTKGISLAATGTPVVIPLGQDYSSRLSEFWVVGTATQVLDVMIL